MILSLYSLLIKRFGYRCIWQLTVQLYNGPDKVHTEQTKSSNATTETESYITNTNQAQTVVETIDGTETD